MEEESNPCSKEDIFFDFVPTSFTSSTPSTNSKAGNLNKIHSFSTENSDYHNNDSVKMPNYDLKEQSQSSSSTDEPESNEGVSYKFRSPLKYNIILDDLNFGENQSFKSLSDNSSTEIKDASSDKYDTASISTDDNKLRGPKNVNEVSRMTLTRNEDFVSKCEVQKDYSEHPNQISSCESSDELFNSNYTTSESENYVTFRSFSLSTNTDENLRKNLLARSADPFLPAINRNTFDSAMSQMNTHCTYNKHVSEADDFNTKGNYDAFESSVPDKLSFVQAEKPENFPAVSTEYICKNQPIIIKVANANIAIPTVSSEVESSNGENNTFFKSSNVLSREIPNNKSISHFCEKDIKVDFGTKKGISSTKPVQPLDCFIPDYEMKTEQDKETEGEIVETGWKITESKPIQLDDIYILDYDIKTEQDEGTDETAGEAGVEISKNNSMQPYDSLKNSDYDIKINQDKEPEGIIETDEVSDINTPQLDDGCIPDNGIVIDQYKGTVEEILKTNEKVLKMELVQFDDFCTLYNDIMADQDKKIDEEMEIDEGVPKIKSAQLYEGCIPDKNILTDQDKLEADEVNKETSTGIPFHKNSIKDKNTKTYLENKSAGENLTVDTVTNFSHEHEAESMKEIDKREEIFDTSNLVYCNHCKKRLLKLGEENEKKTEIDVGSHSKDEESSEYLRICKIKPYNGIKSVLDLFEVDNLLSKKIILAMSSNKFLKSGATQREIVQFLREENFTGTFAKLKLDVAIFTNAAINAGIVYTKKRRNFLSFESHTENSSDHQKNNDTKRKVCGTIRGNAENLESCRVKRRKVADDGQSKSHADNDSAGTSYAKTMTRGSEEKDMKKGTSEAVIQKKKVSAEIENLDKKYSLRNHTTSAQSRKPKEKSAPKIKVTTVDKSQTRKENGRNKKEAKGAQRVTLKSSVKNDAKRDTAKATAAKNDVKDCKKQKSTVKTMQINNSKTKETERLSLRERKSRCSSKAK